MVKRPVLQRLSLLPDREHTFFNIDLRLIWGIATNLENNMTKQYQVVIIG